MAKARSRAAAKKVKDKWKAKTWYNILAPVLFDTIPVAETLADRSSNLIGRVTEISLQDLTNDFRKSHIKLFFKVHKVEESQAHTQIVGTALTSDYIRRMIRRRRSRIDGVYSVTTRDGALVKVKPFAITEKRIQSSQKSAIRNVMQKTLIDNGATQTLNELIRDSLEGKIGSDIYKNCKNLYPVKRIEISKIEVLRQPTIQIEDKKPIKKEEEPEQPKEPEKVTEEPTEKKQATAEEIAEAKPEETTEEKPSEEETLVKKEKKKTAKKITKKTATKEKKEPKKSPSKSKKKKEVSE